MRVSLDLRRVDHLQCSSYPKSCCLSLNHLREVWPLLTVLVLSTLSIAPRTLKTSIGPPSALQDRFRRVSDPRQFTPGPHRGLPAASINRSRAAQSDISSTSPKGTLRHNTKASPSCISESVLNAPHNFQRFRHGSTRYLRYEPDSLEQSADHSMLSTSLSGHASLGMLWILAIRTLAVIALLLTFTIFVLITIFAVTLTILHLPECIPALAAGILQILSLGTLVFFTDQTFRAPGDSRCRQGLRRRSSLYILGSLPAILAAVVTVIALSWMKIRLDDLPETIVGRGKSDIILSAFIIWGCSVVAQAAFYLLCLLRAGPPPQDNLNGLDPQILEEVAEMMHRTGETARAGLMQSQSDQNLTTLTPHRSSNSSEAIRSLRSSLSEVVRPMTSRTKLLTRHRSFPHNSKKSSFESTTRDCASQENGFDTWDTSSVGPHIREAVSQSAPPSAGSGLETIPGSRPESPANALDGPFLPQSPSQCTPNFSRPSTRQRSSSNEDHIHPLFRTSSPTPPPTPTPGTVVTAAPMAGQVINGRTFNRMRSGSLPSSPSPLVHSESFDAWSSARSFAPPRREPTPPIPDFILSAGTRTSFVDYGKRKASLKSTDADTEQ